MITKKHIWKDTMFSRDNKEHENFVKEIVEIVSKLTKEKYKVKVKCTGYELHERLGSMFIVPLGKRFDRFGMDFSYIDCIPYDGLAVFKSRFGTFLEANGYAFNPVTYAIFSIIHEVGHIDFSRKMFHNDIYELYNHIHHSNNDFLSITLKGYEEDLAEEGLHVRYLLSGDEMYCDGFAMTYFRAVTNSLIERGFDAAILTKEFDVKDCDIIKPIKK